jgi:RNA polymerase sigma-70 factor (ECF subfamily)
MGGLLLSLPLVRPRREDAPRMSSLEDRPRGSQAAPGDRDAEEALVERLRSGDEKAFAELIDRYGASMLRVARMYVRDWAVAEEVVQETWLAVYTGIERFEGRSSLRTWLFRILSNRAKTRGERESRSVPFSSISAASGSRHEELGLDPDRFLPADHPRYPNSWAVPPRSWPQERAEERETLRVIADAIEMLPDSQREVIRLRDVEGWSAAEVAEALELSDVNQRVLLHRGRSKVRAALERHLDPELVG